MNWRCGSTAEGPIALSETGISYIEHLVAQTPDIPASGSDTSGFLGINTHTH